VVRRLFLKKERAVLLKKRKKIMNNPFFYMRFVPFLIESENQ
jgi:hypothetical protein